MQDFLDSGGDPKFDNGSKKSINSQIKAGEKILKWAKKLGEIAQMMRDDVRIDEYIRDLKRRILTLRRLLQTAE